MRTSPSTGLLRSRFSLRVLLVIVTVAGVLFAWMASLESRARNRRRSQESIRAKGGTVTWDVESTSHQHSPLAPQWLVHKLGYEYFGTSVSVNIPHSSDANLKILNEFDEVRSLQLKKSQLTDGGMRFISQLGSLDYLLLDAPLVSDVGIEYLSNLKHLEMLLIGELGVGVTSLSPVGSLNKLRGLVVEDPEFCDTMLMDIRVAKQLTALSCNGTDITEAGAMSWQKSCLTAASSPVESVFTLA